MGGTSSLPQVELPEDRVVVITGGNAGIGYEMAKYLSALGAHVIIACRSEARATAAIERMKTEHKSGRSQRADKELSLEFMKLNLSSLKSTMEFIKAFKDSGKALHVLMCNAGIFSPPWGHTEDGYETQLQVNYLGHFLIIAHLLPVMKQCGDDCRIVLTSSSPVLFKDLDLETINATDKRQYDPLAYYGRTKMYQIMQTMIMAEKLSGSNVTINAFNPGPVATEIARNTEGCLGCFINTLMCCYRSPEKGAGTGIYLAASPRVKERTGGFYVDFNTKNPGNRCRNASTREELWNYTTGCLKELLPPDFS